MTTTSFTDKIIEPVDLSGIEGIISDGGALLGLSASQLQSKKVVFAMLVILIADGSSMAASYFNMKTSSTEDGISWELVGLSLVNMVAFIAFGGIPVAVYIATLKIAGKTSTLLAFLSIVTTLAFLGVVQWQITGQLRLTYTTPLVGSLAGILAFFVAPHFEKITDSF